MKGYEIDTARSCLLASDEEHILRFEFLETISPQVVTVSIDIVRKDEIDMDKKYPIID